MEVYKNVAITISVLPFFTSGINSASIFIRQFPLTTSKVELLKKHYAIFPWFLDRVLHEQIHTFI